MFDTVPDHEPRWLGPLRELFGADPETGWMDSDDALAAIGWLSQQVFEQSRDDRGFHSRAGLLSQVEAASAASNSLAAVQAVRLAQFAATSRAAAGISNGQQGTDRIGEAGSRSHNGERLHPLGYMAEFADVEVGAALCLGPASAAGRIEDAVDAVTKTPRLLQEMGAGRIDPYRVSLVTGELIEAGATTCDRVDGELLSRGVTDWTSGRIRRRVRPLVRRLDPAAARTTRLRRAKDSIGVFTRPGREDGTTELTAVLWSADALEVHAAVESLAKALHEGTTTGKTLGECRADALADLILANTQVHTGVTLLVPVRTSTSATDGEEPATGTPQPAPDGPTQQHDAASAVEAELASLLEGVDWDRELTRMLDVYLPQALPRGGRRARPPGVGSLKSSRHGTRPPRSVTHPPGRPDPGATDPQQGQQRRQADHADAPTKQPHGASHDTAATPSDGIVDVEVPGIGVVPAAAVRALMNTVGARITRMLVDPESGTLRDSSTTTYRPTTRIRRFVERRDRHCRFPGCQRDARYCDADHVIPWPQGETTPANLQLLCRHHHRAKHEGGWQVIMTPDGTCTWTSPTGRGYTTHPGLADVLGDLQVSPGIGSLPA